MDRRCFSCASKFSVFKKEYGCKACGHSFCAGCLGFSAVLPQYGNTKQKICKKCHENITSGRPPRNNSAKWSPPENYKKRIAALETKLDKREFGPSGSVPDSKYQGLLPEDRAIAERLDKLREETKPSKVVFFAETEARADKLSKGSQSSVPSVQEIEDRLAVLQGMVPPSRTPKPVYKPPDTRTQVQCADDLLTQLKEEVAIDNTWDQASPLQEFRSQPMNDLNRVDGKEIWTGHNPELNTTHLEEEKNRLLAEAAVELRNENTRQEKILDIAKRLAVCQGKDPETVTIDSYKLPDSDEETEEEAIQRILIQLSEETVLDEASGYNVNPNQSNGKEKSTQAENKPKRTEQKVPAQPLPTTKPAAIPSRHLDSDDEELPWCCICNEDATLRCHDCDDDLYCKRCFREGHDEFDRKEHRTSGYHAQQKKGVR
ncbi:abscission/NoCut checkpoint regulator [Spea bombifrons]|uniref:abscission/NoCut checkpoint regulator n=1 Tax=Spea bombifrons TaxID=233779 RepID=UPI00234B31FE|nr:abscission/NoCut checkpoint regulator [Spea bombifrons]